MERGNCKKINREKSAISAVGISCPDKMMPASTAVTSFFLSKSMFIRLRPVPSHRPFKNSMTLGSRSFLYSSMCAKAFAEAATVSLRAEIVEFWIFGALYAIVNNDKSVCPNSDLPLPFGPKRLSIGN